jgi:glycosyltransferase involved in cell wall biosynthesis
LIVFLGRLSKRKGVDELLDALAHPRMKGLSWKAVLAGDGPIDEYRRRAAELGLSDLVEMPGWLSARATKALCARAGILVLPSYAEGMAMAMIEGLAHGLPVVTTRVGAHEEVITDGQNGIFVRVGDPDDLAAGLANLIKHPELRSRLSAAARANYLKRFSMTSYMAAMQRIYTSMSRTHRLAAGAR